MLFGLQEGTKKRLLAGYGLKFGTGGTDAFSFFQVFVLSFDFRALESRDLTLH